MSMAWEPDRRSNFFFSPPAHLCAVTYMIEISLIVTSNNQFTSHTSHTLQSESTYCQSFFYFKMVYFKIKSTKMQPSLTKKPW